MTGSRMLLLTLIAAAVCVVSAGVSAAGDVDMVFEGHFGGATYAVAVSGNYAYIGQGQDLVVLDVSSPASLVEVGRVMTSSMINGVAVSGDYAYVANRAGLVIVDVSDRSEPTLAGSYGGIVGDARGVAVLGDYVYVAATKGLVIVDVSDRSAPTHAGNYNTGRAQGVAVSGDYVYLAATNGLVIVDISDRSAPTLAGSYDIAGNAYGVAVSGDYAYVSDYPNGLEIVDVSDRSAPTLAGSYDTAGLAWGVVVSGDYAYVADSDEGLVIVDVSDRSEPTLAGSYDIAGHAYGVAVSGGYAYVADYSNGLVIVDVSDRSSPTLAGSYDTGYAYSVAVSGDYAYVAYGSNGLVIVDVSDRSAPTLAGSYDIGYAHDVAVSGDYAYVADYYNGLVIVDVTDKEAPSLAGSYDTENASGVAVSGDYAYVADYYNGLVIVDVTDKEAPSLAGSYDTAGYTRDVVVSGDYAYVAEYYDGLEIVDVSDRSAPTLAGSYDTEDAVGVAVSGDYAYVADNPNGLVIVDVSDRSAPTLAGSYNTGHHALDVVVSGDYAYVANRAGLVIVDVSDRSEPTLAGSCDTEDAWGVAVSGDYAYVADYSNGLVILRNDASGADTTPPTLNIISPASGTTVTTATITVTGTASSPDGIASVTVNGILATGTTEWSSNITLVDGTNTIVVIATDNSGNSKEASITVTLDTTAPVITHAPVTSANESVPIPISATITDSGGIASATLFYRIAGATWTSFSMTADVNIYTASIPASSVTTAGVEYYVSAIASDSDTTYSPATAPATPYSITVTPTPDDGSSVITISAEPSIINISESVTISGNIIPAHSAIVTLTFTSPAGTTIEQPALSTTSGAYRFVFPANEDGIWLVNATWAGDVDHAGNTSETVPFNVISTEIDVGYAIIIAGRNDEGLSQPYIDLTANVAYKTLLKRGFTSERICYLNPSAEQDANGDGVSDVDMISSLTNVSYAINTWAAADRVGVDVPLLLYMADHGGSDMFLVNGAANILTASDLNSYLDQLTDDTGCYDIVVVYEACSSGSFVDDLSDTGRIIVTSTGIDANAGIDNTGAFFSKYFFKGISDGKTIKEAFEDASNAPEIIAYSQLLVSFGLPPQTPLLDDNGDGVGHAIPLAGTGDGSLAASGYIGTQWGALNFPPTITGVIRNQKVVVDANVDIWAVVVDDSTIADVYATIIEPSYNISGADDTLFEVNLPTLHLEDPDADGNYTASFTLTESGNYTVILHATDSKGNIASPKQCIITSTMLGDVNGDDELASADAVLTLQLAASGQYNNAADVNRDGRVTSLDALMIMQAYAGKIELSG